jgi:drug/metabolite transporter (DMT)-like permease
MKNYFYIILATIALACEYLLIKAAGSASPFLIGLVMFATAGSLLALGARRQQKRPDNYKSYLPWALLVGVIGSCCNFLWIYGTRLTTVTNASSLGRLDIVFTLLLAAGLFGEKIAPRVWPLIGLSIVGAVMVSGWDQVSTTEYGSIGDLMIIGAAFMLSLNSFIIKKISGKLGPMRLAAINCGINVLVFGTAWLCTGGTTEIPQVSSQTWGALIACGICSFVFFFGYYSGVRVLPVWEVRLIALSAPIFTALGGWLFLDELVSFNAIIGMFMLLAGAAGVIISGTLKPGIKRGINLNLKTIDNN